MFYMRWICSQSLQGLFGWEKTAVKYFSLFGLNTRHLLYRRHQLTFLRLFAPKMLPKININGNKRKIALGKKETFKVFKGTHFVWYRILLSYKLNMYLKSFINFQEKDGQEDKSF